MALLYYRDPKAESKGFLDGIIDLSLVQQVEKTDLPRNFGFSVHTYEGKNIVFSAITDGIRNNWITSLRKAANLPESKGDESKANSPKPPLTKRSSSFNDSMTITTTKIVRSSTTNELIPPKVPVIAKSLNIPKLTTTPSSSNEQEDEEETDEEGSEYEEDDGSEDIDGSDEESEAEEEVEKPEEAKEQVSSEGVLVDLLETEVDSLKAKLELTQSELYTLHNSNIDLTSQLRQSQAQIQSTNTTSKKYSFTTANSCQSTTVSSSSNGSKSSMYDRSSYVAEELSRTQKELAKQSSEILSLKNQLTLNQVNSFAHYSAEGLLLNIVFSDNIAAKATKLG